jgi:phosphoadenosine phosphosulfate reductase
MDAKFFENLNINNTFPKRWIKFSPIIEWKDEEVWLYILRENLSYNYQYNYGFNRCGCLICPYQTDYIDLLIQENYPNQWNRWVDILKKN